MQQISVNASYKKIANKIKSMDFGKTNKSIPSENFHKKNKIITQKQYKIGFQNKYNEFNIQIF